MCTVSYIPPIEGKGFVLTSNRDEKEFRATLMPEVYYEKGKKLAYPKDEKSGGSWIAVSGSDKICCLLNGAFIAHQKESFHTISRGIILLEFASSELTVHEFFTAKELGSVEPFTLIVIEQNSFLVNKLIEFIWDGSDKHLRVLDTSKPYIWSSVTLYDEEDRKTRTEWFKQFLSEFKKRPTYENVLSFHSGVHTKDNSINLVMERKGGLKTVSITQIIPEKSHIKLIYTDLLNNSAHTLKI